MSNAICKRGVWRSVAPALLIATCLSLAGVIAPIGSVLIPAAHAAGGIEDEISIKYFDLLEGRLAFTYTGQNRKKAIYILDFATLNIKPVAQSSGNDESPRWSPDRKSLLFQSDRTGTPQGYIVGADGSEPRQITSEPGGALEPDWAPDGANIVVQALSGGGKGSHSKESPSNIVFINLNNGQRTPLTQSQKANFSPRWSPKGDAILFSTNEYWPGLDLLLYSMKTKKVTILTTGYESSFHASWSPSGEKFAFCYGSNEDTDIFVRAAKDAKGIPIVTRPARDCDAEWIDEKHFFFAGEVEPKGGRYEIFLVNAETQEAFQVTESKGSLREPAWNPTSIERLGKKPSGNSAPGVPGASGGPGAPGAPGTAGTTGTSGTPTPITAPEARGLTTSTGTSSGATISLSPPGAPPATPPTGNLAPPGGNPAQPPPPPGSNPAPGSAPGSTSGGSLPPYAEGL